MKELGKLYTTSWNIFFLEMFLFIIIQNVFSVFFE